MVYCVVLLVVCFWCGVWGVLCAVRLLFYNVMDWVTRFVMSG